MNILQNSHVTPALACGASVAKSILVLCDEAVTGEFLEENY
jgi:hypothetical protein